MSNFSFSHIVFKRLLLQTHKNHGLFGKGLQSLKTVFLFLSELFLSHDDMEKLHDFEEECAEDYFREKEIQLQSSSEKRIQVINERSV